MFGNVVHGIPNEVFEYKLNQAKSYKYGSDELPKSDADLTVKHLEKVVHDYLEIYESFVGVFPDSLADQLNAAIRAVFESWNSPRAIKYRKVHSIPDDWGTAVNVQKMVFGNKNDESGSGVLFSRDPDNGNNELYGDWLPNAQGEDVVAGIRPTLKIEKLEKWNSEISAELAALALKLEKHYRDMQDMEFTVEDGKLWVLQTRRGERSAAAAFKIAYDMVEESLIMKGEALARVSGKQYLVLNKPQIDTSFNKPADLTGIPAAGSIVTGVAVFSSKEAEKCKEPCVLVTTETTPDDFAGMVASVGILTITGGATCHAAVVGRGMNKTCVVGCTKLEMTHKGAIVSGGASISPGTMITMDGATGRVWIDTEVPVIQQKIDTHVREIIKWATEGLDSDTLLKITVRATEIYDPVKWGEEFDLQLPEEGRVYIDCSRLDTPTINRYMLSKLFTVLKSRPKLSGVIGLTMERPPGNDDTFLGFLGLSAGTATTSELDTLGNQLKAFKYKKWTTKLKKAWVVHLPLYATEQHVDYLSGLKWLQVRTVRKLGELMEVNGMMDVDPAFEEQLKEDGVEIKKFVTLLKDAGRKVERLPRTASKERMVFEVLGK